MSIFTYNNIFYSYNLFISPNNQTPTHRNTQPLSLDQLLSIIGFISKFGSVALSHSSSHYPSLLFYQYNLCFLYNSGQLLKSDTLYVCFCHREVISRLQK